jgi:hypothetical protein
MRSTKCLLDMPTSKRMRLMLILLVKQRTSEVECAYRSLHSPHLNHPRNSLLKRIHLIPHILNSSAAYHGIRKRHIFPC